MASSASASTIVSEQKSPFVTALNRTVSPSVKTRSIPVSQVSKRVRQKGSVRVNVKASASVSVSDV